MVATCTDVNLSPLHLSPHTPGQRPHSWGEQAPVRETPRLPVTPGHPGGAQGLVGRRRQRELTGEQRQGIQEAFNVFDTDKDQAIDYHELKVHLYMYMYMLKLHITAGVRW